ncbi:hypothetical protein [Streptomyces sp. NBC_01408]|uniref:hypothetical protein n=1 Tax=Streptomyces sp. NBC_01408 TaxID=2903855 RepID=UPI00225799C9|nr:hypothetical protein [Streptomyces sp. NBC_01408]MCX4693190.1 hypothetical protein [Streptomyces sp. NBC_01408]
MGRQLPHADVLIAIMGAPHTGDLVTSAFRLAQALLDRGASVHLWTCGHATGLTQGSLGTDKPRNVVDWAREYPTTAALAADLLAAFPDTLNWYACRFCSQERGADTHIPGIQLRAPFKFTEHLDAADKAFFLGVC